MIQAAVQYQGAKRVLVLRGVDALTGGGAGVEVEGTPAPAVAPVSAVIRNDP